MSEAIFFLDREFRLLDLNRAALALDGRPKGEVVGRTLWELASALEESDSVEAREVWSLFVIGREVVPDRK